MKPERKIPRRLLDVLACPACEDRPKIEIRQGALYCPRCGRSYPIKNGVPIMLVEGSRLEK